MYSTSLVKTVELPVMEGLYYSIKTPAVILAKERGSIIWGLSR